MASLAAMMADKGKVIEKLKQSVTTQIQYIHYSKLKPCKENFYGQVNIDDLADAILLAGMIIEPLAVHKTDMGEYEVISGHRRRQASIKLVERGHKKFEQIPCIVITASDELLAEIDDMLQERGEDGINAFDAYIRYILITANSTAREPTDYERMEQAMQLKKIIPLMRGDESLKGRALRAVIAQEMNRSQGQVGVYENIYNNLIPEGMELFKTGQIKVTIALGLAQLPKESQKRLVNLPDLSVKDIDFEKETLRKKTVTENVTEKEPESRISTNGKGISDDVTENSTEKVAESRISTNREADFEEMETEYENETDLVEISTEKEDVSETVTENVTEKELESRINTKSEADFETVTENVTGKEPESRISTMRKGDTAAVVERLNNKIIALTFEYDNERNGADKEWYRVEDVLKILKEIRG